MDYGFATLMAFGVATGLGFCLWAKLLERLDLHALLPRSFYRVFGWMIAVASVFVVFGIFAWNGFDPGTKPKPEPERPDLALLNRQPAGKGGMIEMPNPQLPALPQPIREAQVPGNNPPPAPAPENPDAILQAVAELQSDQPGLWLKAMSLLRRSPRDEHVKDVAPALERHLKPDSAQLLQALHTVKIWGNETNRASLTQLANGKKILPARMAKEALAELDRLKP
jgi:hypothetical protein